MYYVYQVTAQIGLLLSTNAGMSWAIRIVTENRGKSATPGQLSGEIDMEFPPMSPGIPRISPPWMGRGGGAYIQMTSS